VPYSKTFYFNDRGTQRGLAYEALRLFEDDLNKKLKTKNVRVHVLFLPVSRDKIIPYLREGKGDIAVANLTIPPQRFKEVGFSKPTNRDISEIVVTGQELKVGDIRQVEPNIHAGVKYIRFMVDQYYKDEPMDRLNKGLFAFAAYNAGPNRISQLRKLAAQRKLDPNVWFNNVELIAAEKIGRETVTYVSNIYKYYLAYQLIVEEQEARRKAVEQMKKEAK